uniref:Secreted protein n=1 Tax=Strombidium inclinatum TaxID=197538 RepID=A0A7S3IRQ7_9SPIT|mmetsp:Transcript_35779/g.54807  ORF Transcript_35779/g.54807 Transcript_35779/m.54807 type:complete len:231 (+) Transcript_35779:126-818(+)
MSILGLLLHQIGFFPALVFRSGHARRSQVVGALELSLAEDATGRVGTVIQAEVVTIKLTTAASYFFSAHSAVRNLGDLRSMSEELVARVLPSRAIDELVALDQLSLLLLLLLEVVGILTGPDHFLEAAFFIGEQVWRNLIVIDVVDWNHFPWLRIPVDVLFWSGELLDEGVLVVRKQGHLVALVGLEFFRFLLIQLLLDLAALLLKHIMEVVEHGLTLLLYRRGGVIAFF